MQRMPSTDADFSGDDIAQAIKRAEAARAESLSDRPGRTLKALGLSVSVFGLAFLLVVGASSPRHQIFENTVVMERLATKLAHAEMIAPKTVDEIAQLLRRPDYDCRQFACEAWLEKRNLAARGRLQTVLARNALQADAGASK
jgi:4-hydroxyphenylpyruvate dioxygenase-like putative hemolysin